MAEEAAAVQARNRRPWRRTHQVRRCSTVAPITWPASTSANNGHTNLAATATVGGSAHTLDGDVHLSMNSSAGTSAHPVMSQIHMGSGEGERAGILASASGAGSSANTGVTGDVSLSG